MTMPTTPGSCVIWNITLLLLLFIGRHCHYVEAVIRGPNTSTKSDEIQVEDYIVMQMEMAWGMKEMSRYRSHRGDWPTRSASSLESNAEQDEEDRVAAESWRAQQLRRGSGQGEHAGNRDYGFHTDDSVEEEVPSMGEIDEEMAWILEAKHAARTVEDYWDALVAMF
jgi:hypothetical protein